MSDVALGSYGKAYNDGLAAARKVVNDMSTEYQKNFPLADEDLIRSILAALDQMRKT